MNLSELTEQCSHHTETSQLICRANQLTGFCMMGPVVVKGIRSMVKMKLHTSFENSENS